MPLTDDEQLEVYDHFKQDKSAAQSAALLSRNGRKVSRSMVTGYRRRLGLSTGQKGSITEGEKPDRRTLDVKLTAMRLRAKVAKIKAREAMATPVEGPSHKHWELREFGQCAWPVARFGGEVYSCCASVKPARADGKPYVYCEEHCKVAYTPNEKSSRRGFFKLPK